MRNGVALLGLTLAGCVGDKPEAPQGHDSSPTTTVLDTGCPVWYYDDDGDGFGDASTVLRTCDPPRETWISDSTDCDDMDADVHPGAEEACNDVDDDCDGEVDEDYTITTLYEDQDGDSYGGTRYHMEGCVGTEGWVTDHTDCNDRDAEINPGAEEACNVQDDDCDGEIDDGLEVGTIFRDDDGDGYGDAAQEATGCVEASGWSTDDSDCDDGDADVYPGAEEVCDRVDDDCDGEVDEDLELYTWYRDADDDDYGVSDVTTLSCGRPSGYAAMAGDCRDGDPFTNPGEDESCTDGWDRDCDGLVDCEDSDCDGSGFCGETVCDDGLDDDDDGYTDCADDECWGDAACPRTVVSRVVAGDEARWRDAASGRRHEHTCDSGCDCTTTYTTAYGESKVSFTASQVSGSLLVFEPGAGAPAACVWGLAGASAWERSVVRRLRYSTTSSVTTFTARDGFWISGSCGEDDSASLPSLHELSRTRPSWFQWYQPWWHAWLSTSDGTGGDLVCGSEWSHQQHTSYFAYPLLVGDRYVCTSSGDCVLR